MEVNKVENVINVYILEVYHERVLRIGRSRTVDADKLFAACNGKLVELQTVFTVCNLRRLYFPNGIAHRYARMKERGLCGGLPFIIFKECGMPLQLAP